jgi:hypothetical protein
MLQYLWEANGKSRDMAGNSTSEEDGERLREKAGGTRVGGERDR